MCPSAMTWRCVRVAVCVSPSGLLSQALLIPLPPQGLVYNWGCALSSYASHMPGLDAAAKAAALEQAASKLRSAAEFSAGDVAPLNALGVFCAMR